MINVFCSKCLQKSSMLNIRIENNTVIIECLMCGDMKRFKEKEKEE